MLPLACALPTCWFRTWCRLGRLPPRLYQVMVWGAWLATRQLRSRVRPLARESEEDSMRTGYTTFWSGSRGETGVRAWEPARVARPLPARLRGP